MKLVIKYYYYYFISLHLSFIVSYLSMQCSATWQVQGKNSYTQSTISLFNEHTIDQPNKSVSSQRLCLFHNKNDAFVQGKYRFLRWFSIAFLSICVSRLLRNTCSYRLDYSQISRTQYRYIKLIKKRHIRFAIQSN